MLEKWRLILHLAISLLASRGVKLPLKKVNNSSRTGILGWMEVAVCSSMINNSYREEEEGKAHSDQVPDLVVLL